jgi:hypothetical protein
MKRIRVGKYVTNIGVISALLAVFGVIRQSRQMPKDWRLAIVWAIWLFGVSLAVASVANRERDEAHQSIHD